MKKKVKPVRKLKNSHGLLSQKERKAVESQDVEASLAKEFGENLRCPGRWTEQ